MVRFGLKAKDRSNDPVNMVDISAKETTMRLATAIGKLFLKKSTIDVIKNGEVKKGDPLTVAEISSILAVKKTSELIPLCHPIPLDSVETFYVIYEDYIEATCTVKACYRTGVEMEALTGVSVALLNIWDMVKYLEKDQNGQYPETRITDVKVIEKRKTSI
jgi:cyclic pyranopterin phosphate synthase